MFSYYPEKFKKILDSSGYTVDLLIESLHLEKNKDRVFKNTTTMEGGGNSGSFIFFTENQKFVIKTLQGSEKETLLRFLDPFLLHLELNPHSLIARIYGIYTLVTRWSQPIDVIVMQNTAVLTNPRIMTFDLKGST